jgi:hypothetical protein
VVRTSADKDGTRVSTKANLPLRRTLFLRRQCGEMTGTATANFLRMFAISAYKDFSVTPHGATAVIAIWHR